MFADIKEWFRGVLSVSKACELVPSYITGHHNFQWEISTAIALFNLKRAALRPFYTIYSRIKMLYTQMSESLELLESMNAIKRIVHPKVKIKSLITHKILNANASPNDF